MREAQESLGYAPCRRFWTLFPSPGIPIGSGPRRRCPRVLT